MAFPIFICFLFFLLPSFSSSFDPLCNPHDYYALVQFKNQFTVSILSKTSSSARVASLHASSPNTSQPSKRVQGDLGKQVKIWLWRCGNCATSDMPLKTTRACYHCGHQYDYQGCTAWDHCTAYHAK